MFRQNEAEHLVLERGDFLVRSGDIERKVYLIVSGAVHVFYVSEHEELSIRFGYAGSIMTSLPSFFTGQPTDFYIQAIRRTEIRAISKAVFLEKIDQEIDFKNLYITLLEQLVEQQMEREVDILTSSAIERLNRVLKRSPRLFQEIPAKYIASYLRMTPETLSRVLNS